MIDHATTASNEPLTVPLLRIAAVTKRFGEFVAVDDLSLDLKAGEFFALLGPSGCGKTTLLRMLAGFEAPDRGEILLDGHDVAPVLPHRRPVNMMFQNYALFPHLSVRDNIAFGLKRAGMPAPQVAARVAELLALVRLEGFERRKPEQLSGGQRQRVALARALARRPRILLLDEPMAALDKKLRQSTQGELKELQRRLGTTFIIVTHDQEEAMTVADRIGVMDRGRLVQVGTPRDLYETPASRWIAGFVGDINLIEGRVVARNGRRVTVATAGGAAALVAETSGSAAGRAAAGEACIAVRPEKVRLRRADLAAPDGAANRLFGEIVEVSYQGSMSAYRIAVAGGLVLKASLANASRDAAGALAPGQKVTVSFAPEDGVVLEQ
ncbi:MAG: ABC transporter ATP-binding protein [Xanthobacteraceae bacterium]